MTTDNRTNEPTPEQVEAAYRAWITFPHKRGPQNAENAIRAALVAAQGAAPQAESEECDRDGMGICKRCGMGWDARKVLDGDFACPVQPSSGVDEDALIREAKAEALEDAARAFEGGTISLDVFSNEVEKSYWRVANEQRSILVDSLRARAAEYRKAGES